MIVAVAVGRGVHDQVERLAALEIDVDGLGFAIALEHAGGEDHLAVADDAEFDRAAFAGLVVYAGDGGESHAGPAQVHAERAVGVRADAALVRRSPQFQRIAADGFLRQRLLPAEDEKRAQQASLNKASAEHARLARKLTETEASLSAAAVEKVKGLKDWQILQKTFDRMK